MGTPQEDQQKQLTWAQEGLQRLKPQPSITHGLELRPYTDVPNRQLGLLVGSLVWVAESSNKDSVACFPITSPWRGCVARQLRKMMYLMCWVGWWEGAPLF